ALELARVSRQAHSARTNGRPDLRSMNRSSDQAHCSLQAAPSASGYDRLKLAPDRIDELLVRRLALFLPAGFSDVAGQQVIRLVILPVECCRLGCLLEFHAGIVQQLRFGVFSSRGVDE